MLIIAIDGATRRNGKPDCVAAGGAFIFDTDNELTDVISIYERGSTNQRGELLALLKALDYVHVAGTEAIILTDSEYVYNAMSKNWCDRWVHNNWITTAGTPVKNADIWREITHAKERCEEINFYHIKGHIIPFGKATARDLLDADTSGGRLLAEVFKKYDSVIESKADVVESAQELSVKNNGFPLDEGLFRLVVVLNTVADAVATKVVEKADVLGP